jgi:nucleoid-associated protein YgaU
MPFLLFLLSVATLVAVSSKSKASQPRNERTQTFTLDANMPDALRNQVLAALVSGTDPATLDAFGTALQAQYPLSAGLLHAKALSLRAGIPAAPAAPPFPVAPPLPVVTNDPGGPQLDPSMPPALVAFVHSELANETDPTKLLTLANTLAPQYPIAANLLTQRAAVVNVQPSPSPTPAAPSMPTLNMPGLDPGMLPDVAQAVMNELISDNDPAKLQAFAQQIQGQYPLAANLLASKATTILALQQPQAPSPQPTPGPLPVPAVPPDLSALTASTYTVQDGDYPWKIAAKITGHGARWPELVAANPNKARAKDGNFATLLPGEKLTLPSVWSAPAAQSAVILHAPDAPPVIAPQPSPTPTIAPTLGSPADSIALDANIPPDVGASVRNALTTGTDPSQVHGFASAIASKYPMAAELLNAKANALSSFGPTNALVLAHNAVATSAPAPALATYKVKAGDSPSKIAAALVHDGNRWHELVAANPQKKRAANGNFANLVPGEVLQLPPSWANGAPARSGAAQGGA